MIQLLLLLAGILAPLTVNDTASASTNQPPEQAVLAVREEAQVSPQFFRTVNGISLDDRPADVITKKGQPLSVTKDKLLGTTEYHYKDTTVGFLEGIVDYVHIPDSAGGMKLNDTWIPFHDQKIKLMMGQEEFLADDGFGYVRDYRAIKIYQNQASGHITGADFFLEFGDE
ncbi:hypothetical protein Q5741_15630 [Paenibacillus sp. JX-17]|uniref:Copper amine oxidase-like N-terminal domain-containing protein n=1 Tax=Paenibacillus lacisoli TaxID=3064525 RepID=A0ABT9CIS2_9BACL|nr:hypothetical protein [Paenibacillus sp. JX-17]MDO7907842.1 hypothetical protein [Paenibacillus sp. JX-17]